MDIDEDDNVPDYRMEKAIDDALTHTKLENSDKNGMALKASNTAKVTDKMNNDLK